MAILPHFDYSVVSLELQKCKFSSFTLLFQDWWVILGPSFSRWVLEACYQLLFVKKKKWGGLFTGIGLKLYFHLRRIYILTLLTHLTLEHGTSLLLFVTEIIIVVTEVIKTCRRSCYYDYKSCHFSQQYVVALCVEASQIFW